MTQRITLHHGSGGLSSTRLIEKLFYKHFDNPLLREGNDQAQFSVPVKQLVMTTDSYVISPLFFSGGNIGSLAVHGTINDIVMSGARPLYLSCGFILEEGLLLDTLESIVISMTEAARAAGVAIITGDTKVVERGKGDGIFINTTGIGYLKGNTRISGNQARPGDAIILSGTIGDHGIAILSQREGLELSSDIVSDSASLDSLVADMLDVDCDIHCLRDPTRGGLAATLNELCRQSNVGMLINESSIPVNQGVRGACELLGLDPLNIANEGKLVCICEAQHAEHLIEKMQAHPLGRQSCVIGEVVSDSGQLVRMNTVFGGTRIIDWPDGDPLPRIC